MSPLRFDGKSLFLLDQRKIPLEEVFVECKSLEDTHRGIEEMVVRGAPCIGFTALYGLSIWLLNNEFSQEKFREACSFLKTARPTAVNLAFEIDRLFSLVCEWKNRGEDFVAKAIEFSDLQVKESGEKNLAMAKHAAEELKSIYGDKKLNILTHCNTGFLACGSMGTALGVIEHLASLGRINKVWVDETRPYLQGSRLTSYELSKLGIDHEIVVEGAASHLMENKLVDAIFVGADRIVLNGDTANKVGTANLSIIAKFFQVPFYTVAPLSSFDFDIESGKGIEIELREEEEILSFRGQRVAPKNARAFNPSFDITRAENLTGIICEKALLKAPFKEKIKELSLG